MRSDKITISRKPKGTVCVILTNYAHLPLGQGLKKTIKWFITVSLTLFPSKMFFLFLDAIMKVAFLKKCKEAGLINDLFEEILQKLNLIQERLMEENISESGTKIAKFLYRDFLQTYI